MSSRKTHKGGWDLRYVEAALSSELAYVDLYAISDVHRGNPFFNEKAWRTLLLTLGNDPHAFCTLNGDAVEAALKSSKYGDTYRTMPPGEERRTIQHELEPVKYKILSLQSGNHDERAAKDSDENVMQLIAEHLGLEDRYSETGTVLDISFGKRNGQAGRPTSFAFYVTHGRGGGRRPGSKINRVEELSYIVSGVDGYIMGHVHDLMSRIAYRYEVDQRNKAVKEHPVAYVIAGSLLNYGGYAEIAGYAPNAVSMPILRLYAKGRCDEHKHMDVLLPTRIRAAEKKEA